MIETRLDELLENVPLYSEILAQATAGGVA